MDYEQSNQEEPDELDMFERRASSFEGCTAAGSAVSGCATWTPGSE